jgi:membrane fusion protein, multidrug efflux system
MRRGLLLLTLVGLGGPVLGAEITLAPITVVETKALYGRVESRFVVPARSRIGGTLTELDVSEGSPAATGEVVARIVDTKLESQLAAAIRASAAAKSQLQNAETEMKRYDDLLARGATTAQRADQTRTVVEVARNAAVEAEAARAIVHQQIAEGEVLAPAAGRVLTVPVRLGEVVMPGEPVATIAGGGVFLRLAIPERHAPGLAVGAKVDTDGGEGVIEKVYPQIENGRVTADVAVAGLSDTFIGQRILVRVATGTRKVLAVPEAAIEKRGGLDLVTIATEAGETQVTVVPGAPVATDAGRMREILTGLAPGDRVIVP